MAPNEQNNANPDDELATIQSAFSEDFEYQGGGAATTPNEGGQPTTEPAEGAQEPQEGQQTTTTQTPATDPAEGSGAGGENTGNDNDNDPEMEFIISDSETPEEGQQPSGADGATTPQDGGTFNLDQHLQERFSRSASEIEALIAENETLRQQAAEPNYKTDLGKTFDDMVSKGLDPLFAANLFSVDFSKMSDIDVVRYKMRMDNPQMSAENIDLLINENYGLNIEDKDSVQYKTAQARLEQDAGQTRPQLETLRQQAVENNQLPDPAAEQRATDKRVSDSWDNRLQPVIDEITHIEFPLPELGGAMKFKIGDQHGKDKAAEVVLQGLIRDGIEFGTQGIKDAKAMVESYYKYVNLDKIVSAAARTAATAKTREMIKKTNVPSKDKTQKTTPSGGDAGKQNEQIDLAREIARAEGLI